MKISYSALAPSDASASKLNSSERTPLSSKSVYKNYKQTEERFYKIICDKIGERRLDIGVKELCEEASVAKSTFYAHFRSSTEVRDSLEQNLECEFSSLVPPCANKSFVLEFLTIYVVRNRHYFLAVHQSGDQVLLTRLLKRYHCNLVGQHMDDKVFYLYILRLQDVINCWLRFGAVNHTNAAKVATQLKLIPIPRTNKPF